MKTAPDTTPDAAGPRPTPLPTASQDTGSSPALCTTAVRPHGVPRLVWAIGLAAVAAIAVGVAIGSIVQTVGAPSSEQSLVATQDEQSALERLVQLGYVPAEALQPAVTEDVVTRRLEARGLVPVGPAAPAPLSDAAHERAVTRSLVNRGLVPAATLQPNTEQGHTDALIVRGLLPEGS